MQPTHPGHPGAGKVAGGGLGVVQDVSQWQQCMLNPIPLSWPGPASLPFLDETYQISWYGTKKGIGPWRGMKYLTQTYKSITYS